ncbi:MAG: hypothetical protein KDG89_14530 [Geminicoccaceae bacterium]|nr:hypothetical protein [Geminicoccaceae bacterium]
MARKPAARDLDGDILEAAMTRIGEGGWDGLFLRDLAADLGVGLDELRGRMGSRLGVLRLLSKRLDREMLKNDPTELDGMTPRERLFELLMHRFDAMLPYKPGMARLVRDAPRRPELWAPIACNVDRMASWLMEAASIRYHGPKARLARRLLAAAYGATLRVWVDDVSEDQARTLAELDKRLAQLERLAGLSWPGRRSPSPDGTGTAEAA